MPRLTFTNMLADEEALHDKYANLIMRKAAEHAGQAIVHSDLVADYIRTEYGMPTILSTTREITDADELNEALDRYDWVVLNYNLNKDNAALSRVSRPDKLEVMVNEFCMPHCPHRPPNRPPRSAAQKQGPKNRHVICAWRICAVFRHTQPDWAQMHLIHVRRGCRLAKPR